MISLVVVVRFLPTATAAVHYIWWLCCTFILFRLQLSLPVCLCCYSFHLHTNRQKFNHFKWRKWLVFFAYFVCVIHRAARCAIGMAGTMHNLLFWTFSCDRLHTMTTMWSSLNIINTRYNTCKCVSVVNAIIITKRKSEWEGERAWK